MMTVCNTNECMGCMACIDACPVAAITINDNEMQLNAVIDKEKCLNCNQCKKVCQKNNPVELQRPIIWRQGWAKEEIRSISSSGGVASAIMRCFIDDVSYVAACAFTCGKFMYLATNNIHDMYKYAGSKYVKSNPEGIYKTIQTLLEQKKRVLMIGLPCHIAAAKKYLGGKYSSLFYTIDIICHGSPSQKLLDSFIIENGYELTNISRIQFRDKNLFGIAIDDAFCAPKGSLDRYMLGFLRGVFYTDNCYDCPYAKCERVGDLAIGDSWGSELTKEKAKGISLVLCQNAKGQELLDKSGLTLFNVDVIKAVSANGQLEHPSIKPKQRVVFFKKYTKTGSVSKGMFYAYPKDCIRQYVKGVLLKHGYLKRKI